MNILAVDDEKFALESLVDAIKKVQPEAEIHFFRRPIDVLEYVKDSPCDVAFLDIKMRGMTGVELAKQMKLLMPKINIIFTTGYADYQGEAFDLHASGYLLKPVTAEKVRRELDELRHPVKHKVQKRVRIQTFGNFEIFVDDKPVSFKYEKTKEMLAYLVDRCGALCSNKEIITVLWSDDAHASYLRSLKKDLLDTMRESGCADIFERQRGKIGIIAEKVACDYYDWQNGEIYAVNSYRGEYMAQYSWGEFTNASMTKEKSARTR